MHERFCQCLCVLSILFKVVVQNGREKVLKNSDRRVKTSICQLKRYYEISQRIMSKVKLGCTACITVLVNFVYYKKS